MTPLPLCFRSASDITYPEHPITFMDNESKAMEEFEAQSRAVERPEVDPNGPRVVLS